MKKCLRWNRIQLLKDYLHGDPASKISMSIERHLQSCETCRHSLERLKHGDRFARMLSVVPSAPEVWERIEQKLSSTYRQSRLNRPRAILFTGIGILIVSIAALVWSVFSIKSRTSFTLDNRTYKPVPISNMAENTEPHIVTEGVVSEIAVADERGDYRIKLKENLYKSGPFVVCEVLGPTKIHLPQVGKRIRVYGVSRYDSKPGHQWHEVHPVLGIETVQ